MQLEEAYAVEITKLVKYVHNKENPLIQIVGTHQHNINSAMLQTARCLKTESHSGMRQIKDSITEKMKDGKGTGCMDHSHVT